MKDLKNYLTGNAVAYALACLPWVFEENLKSDFNKPASLLWVFVFISPFAAAGFGWVVNMVQKRFTGETPNGADAARTTVGGLIGAVSAALIGFGWYLPIGAVVSIALAVFLHFYYSKK